MNYLKSDLVKMVYAIGEAHGNCLLATHIYKANYPDLERYPTTQCFVKLKERFERTANANYEKTTRNHEINSEENQIHTVAAAVQNPSTSIRDISDDIGISKSTVHRTLKKNKFHPYHVNQQQFLAEPDLHKRLQFCRWARARFDEDPNFFSKVLFTDESSFSNTGRVNRHNFHHYADHNPRIIHEQDHQHRFKVNVWAGICGEYLVGPHFFEGNLNGDMYLQFLQNDMPALLRHIPPQELRRHWFQQDGAPPHYSIEVREHLNGIYPGKWIGRGGPITWPPRSPDLSSLDYFLWGYIKDRVYVIPPTDIENLKTKIRNAFLTITPEILANVLRNFHRRIILCLENNGGHFQQLL